MRWPKSVSRRIVSLITLLLLLVLIPLGAEETDSVQAWLTLQRGIGSFQEKDFGKALQLFQVALTEELLFPEAEYWVGRIYEEEGEVTLAEAQYRKALEMSRVLYIPSDRYTILYRLADLYKNKGRYSDYEQILLGIWDEETSVNSQQIAMEHAYFKNLIDNGINKLVYLYRLRLTFSERAASELGIFYARGANYKGSLMKNLYAVLSTFSLGIDAILKMDSDFEFPDTEADLVALDEDYYYLSLKMKNKPFDGIMYTLDRFEQDPQIKFFLKETEFYRSFYYLGASLFALGYENRAREIWNYLRFLSNAGIWGEKAENQFSNPHLEQDEILY